LDYKFLYGVGIPQLGNRSRFLER